MSCTITKTKTIVNSTILKKLILKPHEEEKKVQKKEKKVTWSEDVIDNENLGRLKSNSKFFN